MKELRRWASAGTLAGMAGALVLGACTDTGSKPIVEVESKGDVNGFLFIDLNGSGRADVGDDGVEGWQVRLEQPGGGVIATETTDTAGSFLFEGVPAGQVVLEADESMLGDTVDFFGVAFDPVTVVPGATTNLQPGITYPSVTVSEARATAPGTPLFTTGVALNSLSQSVSVLHVKDAQGDGSVIRVGDLVGMVTNVGDSVRVRGRTTRVAGQPMLQLGAVFRLGPSTATLEPEQVSTGTADRADAGALDGAFVQIRDADVLEVEDLDDQGVRMRVNDGSGELEILFRPFLNEDPDDLHPDSVVVTRANGLLVPRDDAGITRWTLQPRTRSDYRIDDIVFPPVQHGGGHSVAADPRGVVEARHIRGPYEDPPSGVKPLASAVRDSIDSTAPELQEERER